MYQTILFDLDGTLTDPGEGITNSVIYALKKWNIEVKDRTELYCFIGPPLRDSFMKYFGFSPEEAELAVAEYRVYFSAQGLFENRPYDGAAELLAALKRAGARLLLATSKPELYTLRILDHFGLTPYFDIVVGASMDGSLGKKGDIIAKAMQIGNVDPKTAIMVGDRHHDICGAKENSLPAVGVLYGYGDREELTAAGAAHIAESVEELKSLLLSLLKKTEN
jgi:phosphoglycolate phosphatase